VIETAISCCKAKENYTERSRFQASITLSILSVTARSWGTVVSREGHKEVTVANR
jgi:hypothetical protein